MSDKMKRAGEELDEALGKGGSETDEIQAVADELERVSKAAAGWPEEESEDEDEGEGEDEGEDEDEDEDEDEEGEDEGEDEDEDEDEDEEGEWGEEEEKSFQREDFFKSVMEGADEEWVEIIEASEPLLHLVDTTAESFESLNRSLTGRLAAIERRMRQQSELLGKIGLAVATIMRSPVRQQPHLGVGLTEAGALATQARMGKATNSESGLSKSQIVRGVQSLVQGNKVSADYLAMIDSQGADHVLALLTEEQKKEVGLA